jgi:putative SOS response-associated peptidase YedK
VIVKPADYDRWLDRDVEEAYSLATSFPSQLMRATKEECFSAAVCHI